MRDINDNSNAGFGGWLSVWFLLTTFALIWSIYKIDLNLISDAQALTQSDAEYYHPLWKPLLVFEFAFQFIKPILIILLFVLFFRKSSFFPKMVIAVYCLIFIVFLSDAIFAFVLAKVVHLDMQFPLKELLRRLPSLCIWIPYFLISKRVKATFVD